MRFINSHIIHIDIKKTKITLPLVTLVLFAKPGVAAPVMLLPQ